MAEDYERLQREIERYVAEHAEEVDNGMADPASTDVSEGEEASAPVEISDEEKLEVLNACVTRHPLNREAMYKTLKYCTEERVLRDIEEHIATFPEFPRVTMNQYYMITSLVKAHGLELIERTEDGQRVTPEMKEGLTEDEIDDLVFSLNYRTTPIGEQLVAERSPKHRLERLLDWEPLRRKTYVEILEFIAAEPRPYADVESKLKGSPVLETVINGRIERVQPSVFLDKLERAGVLVWNKKWEITEEGREYLEGIQG